MKIRVSLVAFIVFSCLSAVRALQNKIEDDHFLPPACGGGSPVAPIPIHVTPETLRRHRIGGALPEYPESAKNEQIQAVVALKVEVDKEGNVTEVEALNGPPVLARAAVRALKKWKYSPVVVDGDPLVVVGNVLLTFRAGKPSSVFEGGEWPFWQLACTTDGSLLLHRVDPEYPQAARIAHIAGDVVIKILIDKEGKVAEATVVNGHPLLAESALNAVKQWRYQPYILANQTVSVEGLVTVKFHM
jgi:TonB family protein